MMLFRQEIVALCKKAASGRPFLLLLISALALAPLPAFAVGGKGTAYANALLKLNLQGVGIASIADNTATSPATVLCVALHTADPGAGGTLSTNEAAYPGYARLAVPRTSAGWTVTGATANPASNLTFNAATSGTETENWFSIGIPTGGTTCTGALTIMYRGSITPALTITGGISPQLTTGTAINEQ
jgi:hypothetical protein